MRKYRNQPTVVDNIRFDSKKEAARYGELKLAERGGLIRKLRLQVAYKLEVYGKLICTYRADFVYESKTRAGWVEIVEDVKGVRTRDYILKRKLMLAIYGIEIRES